MSAQERQRGETMVSSPWQFAAWCAPWQPSPLLSLGSSPPTTSWSFLPASPVLPYGAPAWSPSTQRSWFVFIIFEHESVLMWNTHEQIMETHRLWENMWTGFSAWQRHISQHWMNNPLWATPPGLCGFEWPKVSQSHGSRDQSVL